jgi:3-carboxy-cis,cis-muconate cycloisomerase
LPFEEAFVSDAAAAHTSDVAWVAAMLDVEAALVRAQSQVGLVPTDAAEAIAATCERLPRDSSLFEPSLARDGTPVISLVDAVREATPAFAKGYVHLGATTQDVIDTALMAITKRVVDGIDADLDAVIRSCARLAAQHRETPMLARTLMQPADITTFGYEAARWLDAVLAARAEIRHSASSLAVQIGGPAGTLAAMGDRGTDVTERVADELRIAAPVVPWHTNRVRVVQVASALGLTCGVMGKIGIDILLLSQREVGELAIARDETGRSSAIPDKRNPVGPVVATAAARRIGPLVGGLMACMAQEHQRSAGAWQAEWEAYNTTLRLCSVAADRIARTLASIQIDSARMRENLDRHLPSPDSSAPPSSCLFLTDRVLERAREERAI